MSGTLSRFVIVWFISVLGLLAVEAPETGVSIEALDTLSALRDSFYLKGEEFMRIGECEQAIEAFREASVLNCQIFDTSSQIRTHNFIGRAFNGLGEFDSAIVYASDALAMADTSLNKREIGQAYHTIGYALAGQGLWTDAVEPYRIATQARFAVLDSTGAASSLNNLATVYSEMGNYDSALTCHERALSIRLSVLGVNHTDVAASYNNLGIVFGKMGRYEKALENQRKALLIWGEIYGQKNPLVASCYGNIGTTYRNMGDYKSALENNEYALEIQLEVLGPMSPEVASSYNNLGIVYLDLGLYDKALLSHDRALTIQLATLGALHPEVASSYGNIGEVYRRLGSYQLALENHTKSIDIFTKTLGFSHPYLAGAYNNIAMVYVNLGEYQKALGYYEQALTIQKEVLGSEHPDVGLTYHNIGNVYDLVGEYDLALSNLEQALRIFHKVFGAMHLYVAGCYDNLGDVYFDLCSYSEALLNYEKGLDIRLAVLGTEHPDVAVSYSNIGGAHHELGDFEIALSYYNKALEIFKKNYDEKHPDVSESINKIGSIYEGQGRYEEALDNYQEAYSINIEVLGADHPVTGVTSYNIGYVFRYMEEYDSALVYFKRSIDIFENSRSKLESEALRAAYTRKASERYEAIISHLIEMGRPEEAFAYLERSKSKAIHDALAGRYDIDVGKGTISEKIEESRLLASQVEALESQLIEEQARPDSLRNQSKIEGLSTLLAQTKESYFKVAAEIQADPDYAFAVKVEPVELGVIRQDIPPGQILLMSYSAERELYLFLVSSKGYEIRSVPVSRDSLNALISACRKLCGVRNAQKLQSEGKLLGWSWVDDTSEFYRSEVKPLKEVLSELYSYLVEPFESELDSSAIVTFVPSGNLYYLPWGALLGQKDGVPWFLSQRYNWNILTSTELLKCIYRRESEQSEKEKWSLVLVGNPEGAELPEAEAEVTSIENYYPNSTTLIGPDATKTQVVAVTPDCQALHLATHCILDTENPWDSYILLARTDSTDGHWTASEISGQSWHNMQLVTLSACETVLGSSRPGLELESMAKAFSLAMERPPSIIATLWPVADESTREFMTAFYEGLKSSTKSEALRRAQIKLISERRYSHPFFWAPFILIGEWR